MRSQIDRLIDHYTLLAAETFFDALESSGASGVGKKVDRRTSRGHNRLSWWWRCVNRFYWRRWCNDRLIYWRR